MVVRGVEIEHSRELTRDITAIMELLFILNVEMVQKVFFTSGWESRGRKEVFDKEEIEHEVELLHCLEGEQKCCRGKVYKVALEIATIRMLMEDIISMIYVNYRQETRWDRIQTM